ncbi:MAG: hypothetical protein JO022_20425 [Acidobacteriaceae bacterium]|nr:hypothetical protein [Acidobacteriaceae bacterium]
MKTILLGLVAIALWGQSDVDTSPELAKVKRVYVDLLNGGESAIRLRDLLMSSLQSSRAFLVTEDPSKADATLKGAGNEQVFTDRHFSNDNVNAHTQLTAPTNANNGRYSSRASLGVTIGENESEHIEERKHEAIVALRLVNKDGDVIWSMTQESLGGKFLGAAADVADKIAKKLAADVRKARADVPQPPVDAAKK